jgi:ADP-ribosylglycohydrolase
MGNGGAMRAAPLGAYFADDVELLLTQARASAEVSHAHAEGQAGTIAVALAAAHAYLGASGTDLLALVHEQTPEGETRDGIAKALALPAESPIEQVVSVLGNGARVLRPIGPVRSLLRGS